MKKNTTYISREKTDREELDERKQEGKE